MDPWRDCGRRYDPHFFDRMKDRSLPREQVVTALQEGRKLVKGRRTVGGQDYEVRWKRWTLEVTRRDCNIILWTAYHQ